MKKHLFVLGVCLLSLSIISCKQQNAPNTYSVIPYPNSLVPEEGSFVFNKKTKMICTLSLDSASQEVVRNFSALLNNVAGLKTECIVEEEKGEKNIVFFDLDTSIANEGYSLDIDPSKIIIKASSAAGFYYAVQSLKQLLPIAVYGDKESDSVEKWEVPCVHIDDAPRFSYRGMHLDVARHFFSVDEVKRYIDLLAMHKLNVFHWHLTDDQGWRIEIKKYPKLTEVGSIRKHTMVEKNFDQYDNTPYGGYYTQDQIRDIVNYAKERFITIIPEVDLPGHMVAALASYPSLGCTGGPYEVQGMWGVHPDVLCAGKEETYEFVTDVLSEVIELFPSRYIHIGGDECPKDRWKKCPLCQARIRKLGLKTDKEHTAEERLQSYFMTRVEKFLNENDRQIIGWDEILEGGAAPNATVMSWRGTDGGVQAAKLRHNVVMTPNTYLYFDYYQSEDTQAEPLAIGSYVPLERVYDFEPVPDTLDNDSKKYILGAQANLWTEYISDFKQVEYMLLPRLDALSEVQWTRPENKNWVNFLDRLQHNIQVYDLKGYNYGKHIFGINPEYRIIPEKHCIEVTLRTQGDAPVYYTLDGTVPTEKSTRYTQPIELTENTDLKAIVVRPGMKTNMFEKEYVFNKATARKITLNSAPNDRYTFKGGQTLVDGMIGDMGFATGRWIGFSPGDLDAVIDLGETTFISKVELGILFDKDNWIFPSDHISVLVSQDGVKYNSVADTVLVLPDQSVKNDRMIQGVAFDPVNTRYVKIKANSVKSLPAWHGAKGKPGFLFVDEINIY
ncbi:glycoside hydrolase family 20 protein [Coprobacter fastidiosus]|uniref:beta-N-acetylhexosaminidase n=1 Tax=Coprobacter fastidiosus NSB1 = JCM 33896 TaxID=1349822 RepID=A0A495WGA0_9BACT|nr:family 20 glycosylhydrolase [Coprobacter fastidiosus]RKT59795.1 hexosaminidase [Coprobacter fastidiosus NSB1 = JCM 33896]BEG62130.1 glycoside hydrolase family 20 protein [Coprobacter fastidiosus]